MSPHTKKINQILLEEASKYAQFNASMQDKSCGKSPLGVIFREKEDDGLLLALKILSNHSESLHAEDLLNPVCNHGRNPLMDLLVYGKQKSFDNLIKALAKNGQCLYLKDFLNHKDLWGLTAYDLAQECRSARLSITDIVALEAQHRAKKAIAQELHRPVSSSGVCDELVGMAKKGLKMCMAATLLAGIASKMFFSPEISAAFDQVAHTAPTPSSTPSPTPTTAPVSTLAPIVITPIVPDPVVASTFERIASYCAAKSQDRAAMKRCLNAPLKPDATGKCRTGTVQSPPYPLVYNPHKEPLPQGCFIDRSIAQKKVCGKYPPPKHPPRDPKLGTLIVESSEDHCPAQAK